MMLHSRAAVKQPPAWQRARATTAVEALSLEVSNSEHWRADRHPSRLFDAVMP
jgi:hypothetical protein